jgi:hypothetical protein
MATKDSKYADIVKTRYRKASQLTEEVFDRVEVNRNLYKGYIQTDETYEWDYSLVDQQVFPLIRNYIARSNPSMTKVRLEGRSADDFEKRQINQDLVNWEINELDLTTLLTRGFFSNYIAGRAYYKTGWKYESRVIVNEGDYEYEMSPLVNRADMKFVRFNNILIPNRNIPTVYEQPYVMELMQLRVGDMVKENESLGYEYWDKKFINKLKKYGVQSKQLDYEAEFVEDTDTKDKMAFHAATFPVVCMHTLEGEVLYVPLVDNTDIIINKERENPYWHGHYPYIEMVAFPEDDEYYSMSVVDAVGDLQIAGTEVLNQTLTNIRSINNNMWITGASQATTPDYMFKQRPSGIIRVAGDPNDVVPVRPVDSTRSMLAFGQELSTKFERTGGISSLYSSGAPSRSINQTARGAQIIDQNIETNIQMILDLFGEQVLKRMGDHFLSLNPQYITEEQTFAITGKRGVREILTIKPEEISANFDVYTYPEAMVKQTPASRQASLQNMLTILNREVIPAGVQVDLVPIVENLIDSYPEMENIEDIVTSVDEKAERDFNMILRGQMPEVKARDGHMELVQTVSVMFEEYKDQIDEPTAQMFEQYVEKHMRFMQSEREINAMAQPTLPQAASPDALGQMMGGAVPDTMGQPGAPFYDLGQIV